jgi:hypothetical protein
MYRTFLFTIPFSDIAPIGDDFSSYVENTEFSKNRHAEPGLRRYVSVSLSRIHALMPHPSCISPLNKDKVQSQGRRNRDTPTIQSETKIGVFLEISTFDPPF